jgi:hypothetical protein
VLFDASLSTCLIAAVLWQNKTYGPILGSARGIHESAKFIVVGLWLCRLRSAFVFSDELCPIDHKRDLVELVHVWSSAPFTAVGVSGADVEALILLRDAADGRFQGAIVAVVAPVAENRAPVIGRAAEGLRARCRSGTRRGGSARPAAQRGAVPLGPLLERPGSLVLRSPSGKARPCWSRRLRIEGRSCDVARAASGIARARKKGTQSARR